MASGMRPGARMISAWIAQTTPVWSASLMSALVPLEGALAPLVEEAQHQEAEEDGHDGEDVAAVAGRDEVAEDDAPGDQEDRLDVEDDEEEPDQVELDVEADARVTDRRDA